MYDLLWHITLAECRQKLIECESYGYGLDRRRIKKYQPTIYKTVQRHRESYYFWLDLYTYKLLRYEGVHPPLWTMKPEWEAEIAREWWSVYFSYQWQGAKADLSEIKGRK
jgi:hypothetical protein